jgi:hypothetical protein
VAEFPVTQTDGVTEERTFNDVTKDQPKPKKNAAISQKATFKGSGKSLPSRLPAALAADAVEGGAKVVAKTVMRTISKIIKIAGRVLGPVGALVEVAGIAFSLYEEITDILEVGPVMFETSETMDCACGGGRRGKTLLSVPHHVNMVFTISEYDLSSAT